MSSKTFETTILREGSMCAIPLAVRSQSVFGKVRAPVKVTLNGYAFRLPPRRLVRGDNSSPLERRK
jgi:hypothetical protein